MLRRVFDHPAVLLVFALGAAYLLFAPRGHTVEAGTKLEPRALATSTGDVPLFGTGITVLNFWGEHCPPCRHEAPELSRLHDGMRGRGRVIGVSVDSDSLASADRVARDIGMRFPTAVLDRELQAIFDVTVVPTTYLVDAQGTIRKSFVGAVNRETLEIALATLE